MNKGSLKDWRGKMKANCRTGARCLKEYNDNPFRNTMI